MTLTDARDDPVLEPLPGETPLWANTCLTALFNADSDVARIADDLSRTLDGDASPAWRIESLEDRQWEREWLRDFRPMRFGKRLWVSPVDAVVDAADAVVIRLDPGLAFGTGTHPTTALCLEQLEWMLSAESASEKRVLDFGCGSGILAIGSVLLGAADADAVDIDPQAIVATERNAAQNGVANRVRAALIESGDCAGTRAAEYDVVVANILARPLVDLAEQLTQSLADNGQLVLSGLLAPQANSVAAAYGDEVRFADPLFAMAGPAWSVKEPETEYVYAVPRMWLRLPHHCGGVAASPGQSALRQLPSRV